MLNVITHDMFIRLSKLSTISRNSHRWRAHAHAWNQPTYFRRPGYVGKVERLNQNSSSFYRLTFFAYRPLCMRSAYLFTSIRHGSGNFLCQLNWIIVTDVAQCCHCIQQKVSDSATNRLSNHRWSSTSSSSAVDQYAPRWS